MNREEVLEAVKKVKESKERNFTQTVDLIINLQFIDLNDSSNRFNEVLELPKGRGKEAKVCVVAEGDALVQAKDLADEAISEDDLSKWKKRTKAKKLANSVDFFIVEAPLMQPFATALGQVLGPRNKMPNSKHIIPPVSDVKPVIKEAKNSVRLVLKKAPVIHTRVGVESMSDEDLAENAEAVVDFMMNKLEKGRNSIKNVLIKTTMGQVVELNV